jgi:hypothetical protein
MVIVSEYSIVALTFVKGNLLPFQVPNLTILNKIFVI